EVLALAVDLVPVRIGLELHVPFHEYQFFHLAKGKDHRIGTVGEHAQDHFASLFWRHHQTVRFLFPDGIKADVEIFPAVMVRYYRTGIYLYIRYLSGDHPDYRRSLRYLFYGPPDTAHAN